MNMAKTFNENLFEEIRLALLHPKVMRGDLVERLDRDVALVDRANFKLSKEIADLKFQLTGKYHGI